MTAAIGLLTRPLLHSLRADTVTVNLGILPAPDERARIVDELVLASIEARAFGRELRLRLDRASRRVNLEPFLIDRCEVRQIDFERFAKWYGSEYRPSRAPDSGLTAARPAPLFSASTGHLGRRAAEFARDRRRFPCRGALLRGDGRAPALGGGARSSGERQ